VSTFAVITGGGTAGHVLPALAVAEALQERGHPPETLHYAGARRGIETRLLPATPYPHTFLDVVGVQRSLSRRNVGFIPKLWRAVREATRLLRQLRPRVVVSVGGYASLPAVFAARRLGVPIVVVSFDRRPGRASGLASRFAAVSAVAFEGSPLRRAEVTGAPVRRSIREVDRAAGRDAARAQLGYPPDRFLVAVTGGSQGSGALNGSVLRYAAAHAADAGLAIHHVAGERFVDEMRASAPPAAGLIYNIVGFEERVDILLAAADLLAGRGGASTVAEVAVTGVPAILVPWTAAAEDHQTSNVRWLSDAGAAVLLPESDVARLGDEIEALRNAPDRRSALERRAYAAGVLHRSPRLAEVIERVALPDPATTGQ
jgi:UDP-N-acetylglucosamine--N-acetylmuramyl-(pentapeptide) pyrophosphoryl-undecaprenol N-acetylglucosamine transferase